MHQLSFFWYTRLLSLRIDLVIIIALIIKIKCLIFAIETLPAQQLSFFTEKNSSVPLNSTIPCATDRKRPISAHSLSCRDTKIHQVVNCRPPTTSKNQIIQKCSSLQRTHQLQWQVSVAFHGISPQLQKKNLTVNISTYRPTNTVS